jgi:hypothetical protein
LVDGLGSITTVLAGFYVAGLVAMATFFRENSSLDDVITVGPAILHFGTESEEHLTRRQYVCAMFGFLVATSFLLAISSVMLRSFSPAIKIVIGNEALTIRSTTFLFAQVAEILAVCMWMFLFIWQLVLTSRSLYYLMDRIYDVRPVLGRRSDES